MNCLVTVIILTYNSESTIKECLISVLRQSYRDLEVLVCDDCSTDKTLEIIGNMTDPRISLICGESNVGPNGNANRGIAVAKGSYICFAGGDDMFHPDKIKIQVDTFLSDKRINLVCNQLSESDFSSHDALEFMGYSIFEGSRLLNIPFYTVGAMIRWRSEAPFFADERFTYSDNVYYLNFIGARGGLVAILNNALSYYRRKSSGLNASGSQDYERRLKIQSEILRSFTSMKIYALFPSDEVARFYFRSLTSFLMTVLRALRTLLIPKKSMTKIGN